MKTDYEQYDKQTLINLLDFQVNLTKNLMADIRTKSLQIANLQEYNEGLLKYIERKAKNEPLYPSINSNLFSCGLR